MEAPLHKSTDALAGEVARLSSKLTDLKPTCGHEDTINDIGAIKVELDQLARALKDVARAISEKADKYTASFSEDLAEMSTEIVSPIHFIRSSCIVNYIRHIDLLPTLFSSPFLCSPSVDVDHAISETGCQRDNGML